MSSDIHVVLVEPEIHWNTGNAGRSCLAAGATLHLVKPLGFSLEDKQVRRAGLDYWPRVQPEIWESWERFEQELPNLGEPLFFTPDAEKLIWDVEIPPRVVLIFGCETQGLPQSIREQNRDRLVSLPMHDDQLRSLNLSTTVGIALYEVLRRLRS